MDDLISIVVPIYNVENYLCKCINSIINQTYKNIEIILVNDGSTDNCLEICKKYKKNDKRIKIINKDNGGLSSARNAGIDVARGKYIAFIDSDDYIDKDMILVLYNLIKKDKINISICNRFHYYEYEKNKNKMYKPYCKNKSSNTIKMNKKEALKELCTFNLFDMSACGKLFNIRLFDKIKFPENRLSEDYFIMYKLFDLCENISYSYKPLYYYRQRKGSISKNKKINYDYKQASFEQMNYIKNKYPDLTNYVRTAYALANITEFHQYIKNRNEYPEKKELLQLQKNVTDNYKYIKSNEKLSNLRKIQVYLFCKNVNIYTFAYKNIFGGCK